MTDSLGGVFFRIFSFFFQLIFIFSGTTTIEVPPRTSHIGVKRLQMLGAQMIYLFFFSFSVTSYFLVVNLL